MSKIEELVISDADKRKWIETRSALLWGAPAFTHILYSMLNPTGGELAATFTKDVPIAATDGQAMILNPETYFKLPLAQRVFVAAHEIMHCIFKHPSFMKGFTRSGKVKYPDGSELPYDGMLMNVAMDFVINDLLIESKIGEFVPGGCHDRSIATSKDSFIDAYKKVYKDKDKFGGGGGGSSFDVILDPNNTSSGNTPEASKAEWDTAIAAAMQAAKLQGKLPAALERLFGEVLNPEVSWQEHIRAFFARKVGGGGYDWRKPDRRLIMRDIYAPRRSGNGAGDVVVAVDTSGSIGQRELDVFFAEMRGILDDVRPERVFVVWCDAKVHHVDEVTDAGDIAGLKPRGGGGTDFRPVFDWIGDNHLKPDALVYLTDGYGSFPQGAPSYPVLWGDIANGAIKYPFGDVVNIPIKKK